RVVLPWSTCAMMAMLRIMYRIVRVSCTALENNGTRGLDGTPQFTGRARVEGEGERRLRADPGEGGASARALAGRGRRGGDAGGKPAAPTASPARLVTRSVPTPRARGAPAPTLTPPDAQSAVRLRPPPGSRRSPLTRCLSLRSDTVQPARSAR